MHTLEPGLVHGNLVVESLSLVLTQLIAVRVMQVRTREKQLESDNRALLICTVYGREFQYKHTA